MDKLWVVIKREYLERVRSKWFIFTTIFGPVFFAAITILPSYMTMKGMKNAKVASIHILDATGTGLGHRVADRLAKQQDAAATPAADGKLGARAVTLTPSQAIPSVVEDVSPPKLAMAESLATKDVMNNVSPGYLVLDAATLTSYKARYAGRNASAVGQMEIMQTAIRQSIVASRLEGAGIKPERIDSLTDVKVDLASVRLDERGRGDSGIVSFIFGAIVAFMLYMMIVLYGQNVMRSVLEEKMTRVAVGLTQQIVWVGSAAAFITYGAVMAKAMGMPQMQGVTFPTIPLSLLLALVLFFILGYTLYSAMFAAVGAMVGSQEEVQQAAQPVILLLVASIILFQPILLNPSGKLAVAMSVIPFSAPIIMPVRMTTIQVPPLELAGSLIGLALTCLLTIWAAARIYRIGLLMTGKRPNLQELMRWIKYA
jgi:ABC-2 type transport system permease protein